jgi:hypothetical protein
MDDARKNKETPLPVPDDEETGIFRRPVGLGPRRPAHRGRREEDKPETGRTEHKVRPEMEARAPGPKTRPEMEARAPGPKARPEIKPPKAAERKDARQSGASTETAFDLEIASLDSQGFGHVTFDAKGDPVWEWRVEARRRRKDDSTVDLLKCLDLDGLRLEDEADDRDRGIDPYDTPAIRRRE